HPMFEGVEVVKRIVGMPGDFVCLDEADGEEPGRKREEEEKEEGEGAEQGEDGERRSEKRMIQVPQGHCWVVGDNMPHSRDSRTYGPVPLALVKGKAVWKAGRIGYWDEWGRIRNGLVGRTGVEGV
ncbi:MAG: hypothetical protein Q9190_004253, partial [Brigantiaea leucoxantha]